MVEGGLNSRAFLSYWTVICNYDGGRNKFNKIYGNEHSPDLVSWKRQCFVLNLSHQVAVIDSDGRFVCTLLQC